MNSLKMIRFIVLFSITGFLIPALSQKAGSAALPDDETGRCRYGAEYMIDFAKRSLSEERSRPESIEKRRKLINAWTSRLENGEDPCLVYMDIQKAATTF